jgi:radical SAM superfamily enzyme YgiQ (UPF0313 family)
MNIHLIAPGWYKNPQPFRKKLFPPLGLMTLAAHTPEDVKIRIIDEQIERIDFDEVPDLVGITTLTATAWRAYEIAERYRTLGSKVVLGGIHSSMVPEESRNHSDSVVIGEAEAIWPKVISDFQSGRLEPLYRQENFIDYRRPLLPRRDLINPKGYWFPNTIQTARGCPHSCSFCSVTAFNGRMSRMRDIESVLAEMEILPQHNLLRRRIAVFIDDNIAAIPRRAKDLFKALIPMNIIWGGQACITFAKDEELVALAAQSGCRILLIGLESVSPKVLADVGKRQNKVDQYEEALQVFKKYGIHVLATFVVGFDAEEEAVFTDTLKFAIRNKLSLAQFSFLIPYPGTSLYSQLLSENRLKSGFWLKPTWDGKVVYAPKNVSAERLTRETYKMQKSFYSIPSMLRRITINRYLNYWLTSNLIYRYSVRTS